MPRKLSDSDSSQFPYQGGISPTSTGLIERVKGGESAAWSRFMDLYMPLVRLWCKKPGGRLNRQDRQDIAAEILAKVAKGITDFDVHRDGRSLRAWLRTITQNTIADYLETNEKRKTVNRLMSDTGHIKEPYNKPFELPEEPNEKIVLLQQVMKIVKSDVSERDWEIVNLYVIGGKTSQEVAEIMEMKPDTVRRAKNRVIARLRQEYDALGLDDEMPSNN